MRAISEFFKFDFESKKLDWIIEKKSETERILLIFSFSSPPPVSRFQFVRTRAKQFRFYWTEWKTLASFIGIRHIFICPCVFSLITISPPPILQLWLVLPVYNYRITLRVGVQDLMLIYLIWSIPSTCFNCKRFLLFLSKSNQTTSSQWKIIIIIIKVKLQVYSNRDT